MIRLRGYQRESADKTIRYLKRSKGRPVIALPVGAGKTIVMSEIINRILYDNKHARIVVISHVKEILAQNFATLVQYLGEQDVMTPIGIFSAGLKRRETSQITVASIQSMFAAKAFHSYDYAIIDEAHTIPPSDGRYGKFLEYFQGRTIGLTGTPYRMGWGYIYGEDRIFDELIIDYTQGDKFTQLIENGYLCNLRTKRTAETFNTEGIKFTGGDFDLKQAAEKFNTTAITAKAIDELIRLGQYREKWLLFAIDIDHADHITEMLEHRGISAIAIHSRMEGDRDEMVKLCKEGQFRAVVNVGILTTGYDDKNIDLIGLLRPTASPVLHVQMVGRGLRVAPGKEHCLVLDFAGNTARVGPINDIQVRNKGERREGGEAPTKVCPGCQEIVPAGVRTCPACGLAFQFKSNLEASATEQDIIASGAPKWLKVDSVTYFVIRKTNKPDMLLVTYQTPIFQVKEYVCVQHKGYGRLMAEKWMRLHCHNLYDSAEEMIRHQASFKTPNMIKVKREGKYDNIMDYDF